MNNIRFHYLDAMRAILMMLGVVLHSSNIFDRDFQWLLDSPNTIGFASYLGATIHLFRMPAFFVVSGFFCLLTMQKYGVNRFLRIRLFRIVMPFVSTALLLNTLQQCLLNGYFSTETDWLQYLAGGQYVSHLWFLINLVVYFSIVSCAIVILGEYSLKILDVCSAMIGRFSVVQCLMLLPLLDIAILALNNIGFPLYSNFFGLLKVYELLKYAPYFLFGLMIATNKEFLLKFSSVRLGRAFWAVLVVFAINYLLVGADGGVLLAVGEAYVNGLTVWLSVVICFSLFFRFFNEPSQYWRKLSDASYTVYLFHHILVLMVGMLFINWGVEAELSLMFIIFIVLGVTLFIHFAFVERISVLKLMFNGK